MNDSLGVVLPTVDFGPRAVGQCTATEPSLDYERLHGGPQPNAQSYSAWNEFAHGPNPATVWRATQKERRVSWLNFVLYFHTTCAPSS